MTSMPPEWRCLSAAKPRWNCYTICLCSYYPLLRSRWRLCRLTDAACPLRVVSALYRNIQSRKGAGAPPHHPDVSFRGAKRRGNLLQPVTFSPRPTCYPIWYCEIATAPLGPRNDKLGSLALQCVPQSLSVCKALTERRYRRNWCIPF